MADLIHTPLPPSVYAKEILCAYKSLDAYDYVLCAGSSWNIKYLTHPAVCAVYITNPCHTALTRSSLKSYCLPCVCGFGSYLCFGHHPYLY